MFDRVPWKGVVAGVIASAIYVYIVDPLLKYLPSMVLRIAGAISQRWDDEIFKTAAQPESVEGLGLLLLVVGFGIVALWFGPFLDQLDDPVKVRQRRVARGFIVGTLLVLMLLLTGSATIRDVSSTLAGCFHSRVTVLSPHLSDRESRDLAASWTLMRSRADFDAINGRLREYAGKYNVLPVIQSLEGNRQTQRRCI